jgi:hypothetical protein
MSADIVDQEHIHVLVWAASRRTPPDGPLHWYYDNPTRSNHIDPSGANRDEIGQMLTEENHSSINHHYTRQQQVPPTYRYRRPAHTEWSLPELLNAIRGYQYQTCEHPSWETSQAKAFCEALQQRLISMLPGYRNGPWLITADSIPETVERLSALRRA